MWHTIDAKHVYRSTRSANVECIFCVALLLISFFSFFFWRMTDFLASDIQSIATKMPSARNPQSMTEKKWQRWPNDFPESKNSTIRIARAPSTKLSDQQLNSIKLSVRDCECKIAY